MNIFGFAMEMEKESEKHYRKLASECVNKGLKNILNWLADEEVKHYKVFEEMEKGVRPEFFDTKILPDARDKFAQMKEGKEEMSAADVHELALYRKAQEMEKKSEDLYVQRAKEADTELQKDTFLRIAEEERKHYFLIDNIIEMVSRPETWLENAEFVHLDEY